MTAVVELCQYCGLPRVDTPEGISHFAVCIGTAQLNPRSPDRISPKPGGRWPNLVKALRDGRSAVAHDRQWYAPRKPRTRAQQAALKKARANQKQNRTRDPYQTDTFKTFTPNAGRKAKKAQAAHD